MKKILVTGAFGQIGSELVPFLRQLYGEANVVATDVRFDKDSPVVQGGPFEFLDVMNMDMFADIVKRNEIDTVIHMAALLSAVAERKPQLAWRINMDGLFNALEVAREYGCAFFTPSSIGAFGPGTPKENTPQDTIQRPSTMYGVTKTAGELLCDYYFKRFNVDTRGVRFPGLISYVAPPGGGTTDYAVEIYYEALKQKKYTSYIGAGTFMDMMYMPDALNAIVHLMEAAPAKLKHRNAFNVTAMSFDPEMIAAELKKHIPEFAMSYSVDPVRQGIADSWPDSLDTSAAREEWGFSPKYSLATMTTDMLLRLKEKLGIK